MAICQLIFVPAMYDDLMSIQFVVSMLSMCLLLDATYIGQLSIW